LQQREAVAAESDFGCVTESLGIVVASESVPAEVEVLASFLQEITAVHKDSANAPAISFS
jgi:hypothetical protein